MTQMGSRACVAALLFALAADALSVHHQEDFPGPIDYDTCQNVCLVPSLIGKSGRWNTNFIGITTQGKCIDQCQKEFPTPGIDQCKGHCMTPYLPPISPEFAGLSVKKCKHLCIEKYGLKYEAK
mmetsp:Transcript_43503/g.138521  ORF Transcript_43503/g.138521 Transcript_43503/m.138521 type:complete len:124 (+) Transcript_43503:71-442(+)